MATNASSIDVSPAAVKRIAGRGVRGAASIDELVAKLARPRAVWVMVPAGVTGKTVAELASHMDEGDIIIDGGNSYYRDDLGKSEGAQAQGHPLRRLRHQRRRVRAGARLLPDDRRRGSGREAPGPDIQGDRARGRGRAAHPRQEGCSRYRRARIPALRPDRRGPLREDGSQRHRVRPDGGLCRRAEHPATRQRRQARAHPGCRDDAAARPGVLPI